MELGSEHQNQVQQEVDQSLLHLELPVLPVYFRRLRHILWKIQLTKNHLLNFNITPTNKSFVVVQFVKASLFLVLK